MGCGFAAYVFAMYYTTVANTLFIITTETIFLAFFGYIFLKEKINLITFISILLGMYTYRLEIVPHYVPPGHALVYVGVLYFSRAASIIKNKHKIENPLRGLLEFLRNHAH